MKQKIMYYLNTLKSVSIIAHIFLVLLYFIFIDQLPAAIHMLMILSNIVGILVIANEQKPFILAMYHVLTILVASSTLFKMIL